MASHKHRKFYEISEVLQGMCLIIFHVLTFSKLLLKHKLHTFLYLKQHYLYLPVLWHASQNRKRLPTLLQMHPGKDTPQCYSLPGWPVEGGV